MNVTTVAGIAFATAAAGVVGFQVALAMGVPWGSYAMGGAFPGTYPPRMRVAAMVQAVVLAGTVAVVLSRAGLVLPAWSGVVEWLIWGVVAIAAAATFLNAITPNVSERRIWVPVAVLMLVSSLAVALTAG